MSGDFRCRFEKLPAFYVPDHEFYSAGSPAAFFPAEKIGECYSKSG
jgi:hypothetical protein